MNTTKPNPGSSESQITTFTERIRRLTSYLKENKKDFSAKKGLLDLVSKRHRLLKYMAKKDPEGHKALCKSLSLRK